MLSSAAISPGASTLVGLLSGRQRPPGPPPQALMASGRTAMPPPPPGSASGSDPMALFDAMLARRDKDGDGQLSLAETSEGKFSNLIEKVFGTIDSDADGLLSEAEMTAAAQMISEGTNLFKLAKAGSEAEPAFVAEETGEAASASETSEESISAIQVEAEIISLPASLAESVILAMSYEDELPQP